VKERVALPKNVGQLGGGSSKVFCVCGVYGLPFHRVCCLSRSPPPASYPRSVVHITE